MQFPTQLHPAEFVFRAYAHVAKAGVTLADVLDGRYWQHIAAQLRPRDQIVVLAEDNSWEATLRVVVAQRGALRFRVVSEWKSDAEPIALPASSIEDAPRDLMVGWGGFSHKYRVVDRRTKQVLAHGFELKAEAEMAMQKILEARAG